MTSLLSHWENNVYPQYTRYTSTKKFLLNQLAVNMECNYSVRLMGKVGQGFEPRG